MAFSSGGVVGGRQVGMNKSDDERLVAHLAEVLRLNGSLVAMTWSKVAECAIRWCRENDADGYSGSCLNGFSSSTLGRELVARGYARIPGYADDEDDPCDEDEGCDEDNILCQGGICQGDVVRLRSGGPEMTVGTIYDHGAACMYFRDSVACHCTVETAALERIR